MKYSTYPIRWLAVGLTTIVIALGCSEADVSVPDDEAGQAPALQKPVATLNDDFMVQLDWTLPDETFTTTEIERQQFVNEAWQLWNAVDQVVESATTFTDGPMEEGWLRYRVRWVSDSITTAWVESEAIEVRCLGTCSDDPGMTGDLTRPDADVRPEPRPDEEPVPGDGPIPGDDSSPVGDIDPGNDPAGGGDNDNPGQPEDPDPPVGMERPEGMTADDIQQTLDELRGRFEAIENDARGIISDGDGVIQDAALASDNLSVETGRLSNSVAELSDALNSFVVDADVAVRAPRIDMETANVMSRRLAEAKGLLQAVNDQLGGGIDRQSAQDAREALNGPKNALDRIDGDIGQIEADYASLRNAINESFNGGAIDEATRFDFIQNVDDDAQAQQELRNDVNAQLEAFNEAQDQANQAIVNANNFQNNVPGLLQQIEELIERAEGVVRILQIRAQAAPGQQPSPPEPQPQPPVPPAQNQQLNSPRALRAQVNNPTNIRFFWAHNGPATGHFVIERSDKNGGGWSTPRQVATRQAGVRHFGDSNATAGAQKRYRYRVKAVRGNLHTPYSQWIAIDHKPPQTPLNFRASRNGRTVQFNWSQRGPDVKRFHILAQHKRMNGNWTNWEAIKTPNAEKRSATYELPMRRIYRFRIRAKNDSGESSATPRVRIDFRN